ncbi:hypothetical protein CPB86DRAFT_785895 [Serendipita vermifera]|nr:hypothetical protein CPB86DRAFT_785895 [Serendipita vermifera]
MSTQAITSAAAAKPLIASLRANRRNLELHRQVRGACTSESWGYFCEAGYVDFLVDLTESWKGGDEIDNGLPAWCLSAWDIAMALQASNATSKFLATSPLNIKCLVQMREVLVRKLFGLMLETVESNGPTKGLTRLHDPDGDQENRPEPSEQDAQIGVYSCISAASGLLFALGHSLKVHPDPQYMERLQNSGAMEVCTLCWYNAAELATRITDSITLETLIESNEDKASLLKRIVDVLSYTIPNQSIPLPSSKVPIGAQRVINKCKQMLQSSTSPGRMTSGHRLVEMCLIQWLADESYKSHLGVYLAQAGVAREVVEVIRLELEPVKLTKRTGMGLSGAELPGAVKKEKEKENENDAREEKKDVDWELVDMSGAVLLSLSNSSPLPVAALIRYIEEYDLLRIMSKIFLDPTMGARAQSFTNVLELLVHCTTCVAQNCHYVKTEAYINALRHALEKDQLWAETLIRLEQKRKSRTQKSEGGKLILQKWYVLGKEIGLVQRQATLAPPVPSTSAATSGQSKVTGIKVRENLDGCWNTDCEKHGLVDEAVESKLLRCSSCKTARYCSAACQTKDWKAGHKGECKALKAKAG